ncbi:cytochrome c oxidase assembly protein [Paractinoplanes maris]|uniref:cytochrome c oxidase assembly protein n=1 Tax=Paractinoplanes maris TaxID=1734446 RepID=UPI0020228B9C|nr:cytochrome c oxidase assembly protein [Actinoplanes maris]
MIWGLAALAGAYAVAVARLRRRDIDWPVGRSLAWYAGVATAAAATFGQHHDFRAHMSAHLLLGMAAPLLLVLGRPVTLVLRVLPVRPARRVSRLLRTRVAWVLTHPVTAAVLDAGGLWLLYTTGLYAQAMARPWLHTLVQVHMLLAGGLLTAAIIGRDPAPHRPGPIVRGAVFLAFVAAHGILAKHLYGHPPVGVPAGEAEAGAQIMYYGGDLLHVLVIVLFFRQCFAPAPERRPWRLVSVAPAGESRHHAA